jgi:hypothetical protein
MVAKSQVVKLLLVTVLITAAMVSVARTMPLAHADQNGANGQDGTSGQNGTDEAKGQNNDAQCGSAHENQGSGEVDTDDTSCDVQG